MCCTTFKYNYLFIDITLSVQIKRCDQGGSQEHISLIIIMFCFNEFAFTVQVKHKINSTQILGFILICLHSTTGHFQTCVLCAFSALTLLVGRQEGHATCKKWVVGCWRGYLPGARCRLAYGPADATATHRLFLQWNPDWFYLSGTGSPG